MCTLRGVVFGSALSIDLLWKTVEPLSRRTVPGKPDVRVRTKTGWGLNHFANNGVESPVVRSWQLLPHPEGDVAAPVVAMAICSGYAPGLGAAAAETRNQLAELDNGHSAWRSRLAHRIAYRIASQARGDFCPGRASRAGCWPLQRRLQSSNLGLIISHPLGFMWGPDCAFFLKSALEPGRAGKRERVSQPLR